MSVAARVGGTALVMTLALASGCAQKPVDATPEGAVRELLERMEHAEGEGDEAATRGVYELLAAPTREALELRAARASAATARRVSPADMIAPAHFSFRFRPRQFKAKTTGDRATVDVVGIDPAVDRASVPCVREDGHWRVEIPLPPLPPVQHRPDGGT